MVLLIFYRASGTVTMADASATDLPCLGWLDTENPILNQ